MSDEPKTHQLDAHELMKFLDQLAPEVKDEQRAQLVFVDQRVQRVDASANAHSLRAPSAHAGGHRRLAHVGSGEPREQPLELTMIDAEPAIDAEVAHLRRGVRQRRRAIVGGLVGLATFALLALAAARSRDRHGLAVQPPPLPQPTAVLPTTESSQALHEGEDGARVAAHPALAGATDDALAPASAEAPTARPAGAARGPTSDASEQGAPGAELPSNDAAPAHATAHASAQARRREAASSSTRGRPAPVAERPVPPGARRHAVDLLLAGESRAALDAYRALTRGASLDPTLAHVVRLLERELSDCGGAPSCRP